MRQKPGALHSKDVKVRKSGDNWLVQSDCVSLSCDEWGILCASSVVLLSAVIRVALDVVQV